MATHRARVGEGGRVVIPSDFRRELGIRPGDDVLLEITDDAVRIRSLRGAMQRAQALVRRHVTGDVSLSEELIQERREVAKSD